MTKQIIGFIVAISITIGFSGCGAKVYQSEGKFFKNNINHIEYALIKNQKSMGNNNSTNINMESSRVMDVNSVIVGSLLKQGISTLNYDEFKKLSKESLKNCIILEWGMSGRDEKFGGGYSQEATVLIRSASTKKLIYRGLGEFMGHDEFDDVRGALLASLKKFKVN